jgi:hypothetical protein
MSVGGSLLLQKESTTKMELTFKEKGAEKDFLPQRQKSTIAGKKFNGLHRQTT